MFSVKTFVIARVGVFKPICASHKILIGDEEKHYLLKLSFGEFEVSCCNLTTFEVIININCEVIID